MLSLSSLSSAMRCEHCFFFMRFLFLSFSQPSPSLFSLSHRGLHPQKIRRRFSAFDEKLLSSSSRFASATPRHKAVMGTPRHSPGIIRVAVQLPTSQGSERRPSPDQQEALTGSRPEAATRAPYAARVPRYRLPQEKTATYNSTPPPANNTNSSR